MTYYERTDPDGVVVSVIPLTFGRARITISSGPFIHDDGW